PAKPLAACVYLWARSPSLCNGPRVAGKGFVRSRTEGQLILQPGLRCQLGHAAVRWSQINPILKLTGDPELAFSNACASVVAQRSAQVGYGDILAAERSVISARCAGAIDDPAVRPLDCRLVAARDGAGATARPAAPARNAPARQRAGGDPRGADDAGT